MNNNYARITVLVIAYKQEKLISRALDSILAQKEYGLKEIIVCDDCSPDGTWDVIMRYKEKYPQYISPHRNDPNKGIYGNIAYSYSLTKDTDYIYNCSGDDAICDGFFKAFQEYRVSNNIPKDSSHIVYGDYKVIDPYSNEHFVSNNSIVKYPDVSAVDLKMRQLLSPRSAIISYECFKRFDSFPLDKGVPMAEEYCDLQLGLHSDKNYYLPYVGSIYYANIGVSTTMVNKTISMQRIEAWQAVLDTIKLTQETRHSVLFNINLAEFDIKKRLSTFLKVWWHYSKSGRGFRPKYIFKTISKMLISYESRQKLKRVKSF